MASPANVLLRLIEMPAADRRVSIMAAMLTPLFHLGIRVAGLARVMRWVSRGNAASETAPIGEISALAATVERAATHSPGGATCLTRSLLLQWLLRRRAIAAQLRIGVRLTNGVLEAHAWVEYRGERVNDRLDVAGTFLAFDEPVRAARHTTI